MPEERRAPARVSEKAGKVVVSLGRSHSGLNKVVVLGYGSPPGMPCVAVCGVPIG